LAVRQNPHSPSLTNPRERSSSPSLPNAIDIRFLPGERLHRQQAVENEGAIGLTHRSCFRVAAAPTLATRGAMIHRIIFDDSLVFEGKKTGEKGGRQMARGELEGLLGGCSLLAPIRHGIRESIRQCLLPSPAGLECKHRRIGSGGLHPHRCGHGRRSGSPVARAAFRERSGIFPSPLCPYLPEIGRGDCNFSSSVLIYLPLLKPPFIERDSLHQID
jgi:hypothetical protein